MPKKIADNVFFLCENLSLEKPRFGHNCDHQALIMLHHRTDSAHHQLFDFFSHFLCVQMMRKLGAVEQLFTSDGQFFLNASVPLRPANDVLLTVNFMKDKEAFSNLKRLQVSR